MATKGVSILGKGRGFAGEDQIRQPLFDGVKAVSPFGMAGGHDMGKAGRMVEKMR